MNLTVNFMQHVSALLFTFYTVITFANIISIIPGVLASFYWLYLIKVNIVNKRHGRSWRKFFKFLINSINGRA